MCEFSMFFMYLHLFRVVFRMLFCTSVWVAVKNIETQEKRGYLKSDAREAQQTWSFCKIPSANKKDYMPEI